MKAVEACPSFPMIYRIVVAWLWLWVGGVVVSAPTQEVGVRFPNPPTLEKCAKGIRLCNLLRSTQRNDRETVIEG